MVGTDETGTDGNGDAKIKMHIIDLEKQFEHW